MNITGMLHGARLLKLAGFPTPDILGPDASESEIKALIVKHGRSARPCLSCPRRL